VTHKQQLIFKIFTFVGYYAASSGNPFPTFRDNLWVPSSRAKKNAKVYWFQVAHKGDQQLVLTITVVRKYDLKGGELPDQLDDYQLFISNFILCSLQTCT
jgi:hypothetical protein